MLNRNVFNVTTVADILIQRAMFVYSVFLTNFQHLIIRELTMITQNIFILRTVKTLILNILVYIHERSNTLMKEHADHATLPEIIHETQSRVK